MSVEVMPNKFIYDVGDTLKFRFYSTDSIYDISARRKHLIREFPFRPGALMFNITSDSTYKSGNRVNSVIVDEKYDPVFISPGNYVDFMRANTVYENGEYIFEYEIVLETSGKYLMYHFDRHNDNQLVGKEEDNAIADNIEFERKCEETPIMISYDLTENANFEEYSDCWEWLDENVYGGMLISADLELRDQYDSLTIGGDLVIERAAPFAFEVVE